MKLERDAVKLERELLAIEVGTEVPLLDCELGGSFQRRPELVLALDQQGTRPALAIVELGGGGDENAPSGHRGIGQPC